MENYAIYSHEADFEAILQTLKSSFPKAQYDFSESEGFKQINVTIKGGLFSTKQILKIHYRQRTVLSHRLEQVTCAMTHQLVGLYNFVENILPLFDDLPVKSLLQRKIETINSEFIFIVEPKMSDKFLQLFKNLTTQFDAIVFAQPHLSISQSNVPHFLDKSLQLIMDVKGKVGNSKLEVKIKSNYFDPPAPPRPDQMLRKKHSEAFLAAHQVVVNAHLPPVASAETVRLRLQKEVIERTYALTLIAAAGEGVAKADLENVKKGLNINGLSPFEQQLYNKNVLSDAERLTATWRYEGLNLMLWALKFTDTLAYPSGICDVGKIVGIVIHQSRTAFETHAALRTKEELLDELDKIYRMNWACVNARLKGQIPSGGLDGGVVYERHYALNWLTCYENQDWDYISTHT